MVKSYFFDTQTVIEIGQSLWQLRRDKRLQLHQLSAQIKIPANIIERMEIGRSMPFGTLRKLMDFYGVHITIKLE